MNTSTSNESWEKLPKRVVPILQITPFIRKIAVLALMGFFWVVGIRAVYLLFQKVPADPSNVLLGLLVFYPVVGYITYRYINYLNRDLRIRNMFLQSQSSATARILDRRVIETGSDYGPAYTYHLQLEFAPLPTMVSSDSTQYKVQISEKLYKDLSAKETVNITCAAEDPRIFILEGEYA